MRTGEVAEWLDVSTATVKNWTSEFADYLSDEAQGGDTRRNFSEQDIRIMLYVSLLRGQNAKYSEIGASLDKMLSAEWVDLPPLPERPPGIGPVELMPVSEHESAINLEKARLLQEISLRKEQIVALETQLETEQIAHNGTREQLTTAREELGELRGKLSASEETAKAVQVATDAQIEALEATTERERTTLDQERARERKLYTYGLVAVAVVAAVLLAVVLILALGNGIGG